MSQRPYTPARPKADPIPDPSDRLFYSQDGTDIRVTLKDGGVAIVNEPRTLPAKFHREATKQGCLVQLVSGNQTKAQATKQARQQQARKRNAAPTPEEVAADSALRIAAIEQAINDALDSEEGDEAFADAWTQDEKVDLNWLSERVGFVVEPDERDVIQARVMAEEDDEAEEDPAE